MQFFLLQQKYAGLGIVIVPAKEQTGQVCEKLQWLVRGAALTLVDMFRWRQPSGKLRPQGKCS